MHATIAPIMNSASRAQPAARPEAASAPNASASQNAASVTANDFLQLLVTEMKNQDPTANTDPTTYISQLVQVNSLEQLVEINQELGGGSSVRGTSGQLRTVSNTAGPSAAASSDGGAARGNLAMPKASAAAAGIAGSLVAQPESGSAAAAQSRILSHTVSPGTALTTTLFNSAR